jgi:hypothetical protein
MKIKLTLAQRIKLWWFFWNRSEKYKHPIYKEYLYWFDRFCAWWDAIVLRRAMKLADARADAENKRIYVLPDDKGKPRAFNSKEIELLKRHKLMSRKATCNDLFREALYIANPKHSKNGKRD